MPTEQAAAGLRLETPGCLCGETSAGATIIARDEVTGANFTYLRCPRCGLERLCPRPVIGEMGRYYPETYTPSADLLPDPTSRRERIKRLTYETFHATPAERSKTARRWRWLLRVILSPLRHHFVLSFTPSATRRVFEFGAGTGNDLVDFRAAGWEVFGCEPSAAACATAAAHGITLQPSTAEQAMLPPALGCVYMNNVFEHLHDPYAVLLKAREALLPGGLVVLVVPNHRAWSARLFGAAWPGYDPPRHIWGFSPAAMRRVLAESGFTVVALDQRYPFSTSCWWHGVVGDRLPNPPGGRSRLVLARLLRRGLVGLGMLAALAGHGDYIRVVARKP